MAAHTLHTCPLCEAPIKVCAGWQGRVEKRYTGENGAKVELGYSVGGWGHRQDWANFSGEVCDACFKELGRLLEPVVAFLRGGARSKQHNISPLRGDEPPPERRGVRLLRSLSSFRP